MKPTTLMLACLLVGCISSTPGVVRTADDNPLVTIGAGEAQISASGDAWRVWYVVDRATETCWIKLGDSGAGMECCQLRRVASAAQYITWETDESCGGARQSVESSSVR